jgi:hypothetical protein
MASATPRNTASARTTARGSFSIDVAAALTYQLAGISLALNAATDTYGSQARPAGAEG